MSYLADLPPPFFVLAPMDDVTDTVFRRMIAGCAPPDVFFTEFVNVDGLQSPGRPKLLRKLRFTPNEQPLVAQIWGKEPENFYKTARELADGSLARELGLPAGVNYAGVDLNMGCPDKAACRNGTCAALIHDRPLAAEIITATRQGLAGQLPLSVKTRLGFNQIDMTWIEFLLGHRLDALTIHGRTRREMSKVPAHWDCIGEARALRDRLTPETLIIGNGDVRDRAHGLALAKRYRLDGIMIGRGILHDPFAFAEQSPWRTCTVSQRRDLYEKHVKLFAATWRHDEYPIHVLNKFCKLYINGFDGAKELRERLMAAHSTGELLTILSDAQNLAPILAQAASN